MEDEVMKVTWNTHQNALISVLDKLLQSETLVDCTLAAGGRHLKVHKVIISACSPYLKMLLSGHNENHPILILNDTSFDDLQRMVEYMYKGSVNIKKNEIGQFLKAAEALQIRGLTNTHPTLIEEEEEEGSEMKDTVDETARQETQSREETDARPPEAKRRAVGERRRSRERTMSVQANPEPPPDEGLIVPKVENCSDDNINTTDQEFDEAYFNLTQQNNVTDTNENWEVQASGSNTEIGFDNSNSNVLGRYQGKITLEELPDNFSWFDEEFEHPSKNFNEMVVKTESEDELVVLEHYRGNFQEKDRLKVEAHVCPKCKIVLPTREILARHLDSCRWNKRPAADETRASKDVDWQKKLYLQSKYKCPRCEASFFKADSLSKHRELMHKETSGLLMYQPTKQSVFWCSLCLQMMPESKTTTPCTKGKDKIHQVVIVPHRELYRCEKCSKYLLTKEELSRHMNICS